MEPYASYDDFTAVYSAKGVDKNEVSSGWLPYGTQRVNEALGGWYTLPFSNNNETAKSLTVDFAYLGILIRTKKAEDSKELKEEIWDRITSITSGGSPMITSSYDLIYPDSSKNNVYKVYSNTEDYKPIFDLRNPIYQRVDPDQLNDQEDEDFGYSPYDY